MKDLFTLQPGETLEREFRTTRLVWLPAWVGSSVLIVAAFFFMVRLLREGAVGTTAFAVMLCSGVWIFGRAWVRFSRTRLVITSERVIAIRQKGWFEVACRELPLQAIESVSFRRKGVFQAVFRYGKLKVETKGESGRMVFDALSRPDRVQELISSFLHHEPRV